MSRPALCLALSLLLPALTFAEPHVTLPTEIKAKPGRLIRITADSTGKQVRWLAGSDECDLIPFPDGKAAIFSAPSPGRYRVFAWTAEGDIPSEAAVCTIVVEGPSPPPGPIPPPVPPPEPSNPLKAAWDAENAPGKRSQRDNLVVAWRWAVIEAQGPEKKTLAEVYAAAKAQTSKVLKADELPAVRKAISAELSGRLPTTDEPLTPALRTKLVAEFTRIADLLEKLP